MVRRGAVLHSEVELLATEPEPEALRVGHVRRLGDALEAEQPGIERERVLLAGARHHDLDVVDAHVTPPTRA